MINPIYLTLTTPQSPTPGCGPQYKQALISWHGGAAVQLDRPKETAFSPARQESTGRGTQRGCWTSVLRGLQGWPDKSPSKVDWIQYQPCSKQVAALAEFPRLTWTFLLFYRKRVKSNFKILSIIFFTDHKIRRDYSDKQCLPNKLFFNELAIYLKRSKYSKFIFRASKENIGNIKQFKVLLSFV